VDPSPLARQLHARVVELRAVAFDLVNDIPRGYRLSVTDDLSLAAVRMQSVANELGVIEGLLAAAAGELALEREAA
jgi:hypothetical protein